MSLRPLFDSFFRPIHRMRLYPSHFLDLWEPFNWPSIRRSPADMEFDNFVRSVDERFAGMFANVRQQPQRVAADREGMQEVCEDPNKYEMKIAVQDFEPDDIKVKIQGDDLVVEAKKEEKREEKGMFAHSFRQFRRTFPLPEGVDKKSLTTALSESGILEIEAPRVPPAADEKKHPEKTKIDVTLEE